ncbi:putative phage terminase [Acinetobacter baumannii ABNIH10]|nr:putative phage terminase [Acinetobacter baumannii ABNIH10]
MMILECQIKALVWTDVGDAGGYPIAKRFPVIIQKIFKRRAIAGFSR